MKLPEDKDTARVHRFRDRVAVSIGDGPTVYLSADLARNLAMAFLAAAHDVAAFPRFRDSKFPTTDVQ